MGQDHEQLREQLHERLKKQMKALFDIDDISGFELMSTIQRVAHISEMLECQSTDEVELSGPRWRLMLRLLFEEQMGSPEGITPTVLSHSQRVSKNTISALLRGLEEQGLIQRNLDPKDLRVFRIQLTPAGRNLIMATAPGWVNDLNQMVSVFTPQEREQLFALLNKLQHNLMAQVRATEKEPKEN